MKLSVVIITKNEATNIRECLASVAFADEIVVVDSQSTDGTPQVCREMGAKVFDKPFVGYGPQKNFGIEQANGDWILNVDADERVTAELRQEIESVIATSDAADGYWVARKNYFGNKWIRHGGWFPDYTLRLFRNGKGRFNERSVHEAVQVNGRVGKLHEALIHYTCRDFNEFERRQERYAQLAAQELAQAGRKSRWTDIHLRPSLTFLKMYFLKAGFPDGTQGWALARLYARYTQSKYEHLKLLNRNA